MTQLSFMEVFGAVNTAPSPLENLTDTQIVKQIERATGLRFTYDDEWTGHERYTTKRGSLEVSVSSGRLKVDDFAKIVCVNTWDKKRQGGTGSPCRTVGEAIEHIKRELERSKQNG